LLGNMIASDTKLYTRQNLRLMHVKAVGIPLAVSML